MSCLAQTCKLVLGSWTKTGWELDIVNINGENVTAVDKYVTSCINMREALFLYLSLTNAALVCLFADFFPKLIFSRIFFMRSVHFL
jgi:hypothetical protein